MKSFDADLSEPSKNETDNSQEITAEEDRFDMSLILEVPRWKRVLKAIDLPVQFVRLGLLASKDGARFLGSAGIMHYFRKLSPYSKEYPAKQVNSYWRYGMTHSFGLIFG